MPELPEVEFTRRQIVKWAEGQRLEGVEQGPHALPSDADVLEELHRFVGCSLRTVERCGKYLFFGFDEGWIHSHLAMTGKWIQVDAVGSRTRFVRFMFHFKETTLAFVDTRKFGKLEVLNGSSWRTWLRAKKVGLDVFDDELTSAELSRRFARTKRPIKTTLLDQGVLAGVGNIYACEALFLSRISPTMRACDLSLMQAESLLGSVRQVMTESLDRESGEEIYYLTEGNPDNHFRVYAKRHEPCEVCGAEIQRITQQARSTFFCPTCQVAID